MRSLILIFTLLGLSMGLIGCEGSRSPKDSLPVMGAAPDFTFLDTQEEQFRFRETDGRVRVVSFFFARCPSICPRINSSLQAIQRALPSPESALFVSISVDPENDTPQVLAEYAKKYRGSSKNWKFLTGDSSTVESLLSEGFRLASGMLPDEHNTRVVLVDRQGRVRGYYQGMDSSHLERLKSDLLGMVKDK